MSSDFESNEDISQEVQDQIISQLMDVPVEILSDGKQTGQEIIKINEKPSSTSEEDLDPSFLADVSHRLETESPVSEQNVLEEDLFSDPSFLEDISHNLKPLSTESIIRLPSQDIFGDDPSFMADISSGSNLDLSSEVSDERLSRKGMRTALIRLLGMDGGKAMGDFNDVKQVEQVFEGIMNDDIAPAEIPLEWLVSVSALGLNREKLSWERLDPDIQEALRVRFGNEKVEGWIKVSESSDKPKDEDPKNDELKDNFRGKISEVSNRLKENGKDFLGKLLPRDLTSGKHLALWFAGIGSGLGASLTFNPITTLSSLHSGKLEALAIGSMISVKDVLNKSYIRKIMGKPVSGDENEVIDETTKKIEEDKKHAYLMSFVAGAGIGLFAGAAVRIAQFAASGVHLDFTPKSSPAVETAHGETVSTQSDEGVKTVTFGLDGQPQPGTPEGGTTGTESVDGGPVPDPVPDTQPVFYDEIVPKDHPLSNGGQWTPWGYVSDHVSTNFNNPSAVANGLTRAVWNAYNEGIDPTNIGADQTIKMPNDNLIELFSHALQEAITHDTSGVQLTELDKMLLPSFKGTEVLPKEAAENLIKAVLANKG